MANFEKIGDTQVKFELSIPSDVFEKGMQFAYNQEKGRFAVPGFRKGKVPRGIIEKNYGESVFYDAAFDHIYWDTYITAVNESKITPVDMPRIEVTQIGTGQDLLFTAFVPVLPEFEVEKEQYIGIEIDEVDEKVLMKDVDAELEKERNQQARFVEVDRPVKNGDRVQLDYSGSVDGEKFEGGTATNQMLEIGSGRFIPGFEEQLIGLKIGEESAIDVTFPEEYHSDELAGKEAVFEVKILEIKEKSLPKIDDEFAKDVSEFDTLKEYKESIKAKLTEAKKSAAENERRQAAISKIVENVPFSLPDAMIERQINRMVENVNYQLSSQGLTAEQYFSFLGIDMQTARDQMRGDAERKVRSDLILEQIIKAENIVATDEDLDAEINRIAEGVGKTREEVEKMITDNDREQIKLDIAAAAALDMIVKNAKVVKKKTAKKESKNDDESANKTDTEDSAE